MSIKSELMPLCGESELSPRLSKVWFQLTATVTFTGKAETLQDPYSQNCKT